MIPSGRCCGRPRARASWPPSLPSRAIGRVSDGRRGCCDKLGYSLQAPRKTLEGKQHPDRNAQFEHINETVAAAIAAGQPAISIDTKKKELVGEFKNAGREWQPEGQAPQGEHPRLPEPGRRQGDPLRRLRHRRRHGFVTVGIDHDTAQFAVAAIQAWWQQLGASATPTRAAFDHRRLRRQQRQPHPPWKIELQQLADKTGLPIRVCHFPPGTSKWNKIEHRLFSFISNNWRGRPLITYEVIINLIAATTTSTGLDVYARLDERDYPKDRGHRRSSSPPSTSPATRSTPNGTTPSNHHTK